MRYKLILKIDTRCYGNMAKKKPRKHWKIEDDFEML